MELICYLSAEDVARAVSASVARGEITPTVSFTDAGAQTAYSRDDIEVALGAHLAAHERLDACGAYSWKPEGVYVTVRRQPHTPQPPAPVQVWPQDRAAPAIPATPVHVPLAPAIPATPVHVPLAPAAPAAPTPMSSVQALFSEAAAGAGTHAAVVAPQPAWESPRIVAPSDPHSLGAAYSGPVSAAPSDIPPRPESPHDADAAKRAAWLAFAEINRRGGMGLGPVREGQADLRGRDLKVQLGLLPPPTDPEAAELPPVSSIVARLRGAP